MASAATTWKSDEASDGPTYMLPPGAELVGVDGADFEDMPTVFLTQASFCVATVTDPA